MITFLFTKSNNTVTIEINSPVSNINKLLNIYLLHPIYDKRIFFIKSNNKIKIVKKNKTNIKKKQVKLTYLHI